MSLVRDALAKAEREAAARAAREQGIPPAGSTLPQPYRARRRGRWRLALGLVAAAVVGAGLALVLRSPLGDGARSEDRSTDAGMRSATPPTEAGEPPAREVDVPAAPAPATAAAVTTPPAVVPAAEPAPSAGGDATSLPPAAVTATSPPPPPRLTPSGAFVREVELGDGRSIRLGGIAWSEAAPLAYLNGRLVGVGEYVEGFQVVAIDRELVVFDRGGEGNFIVRLR